MTDLIRIGKASVAGRAHRGMWIADCPYCRGAVQIKPGTGGFDCPTPGCGERVEVTWPSPDVVEGVARLLSMRPDPETRNWFPGETLIDLTWENADHGIFSGLELPGGTPLVVEEGRIRTDRLPELLQTIRQELTP